MSAKTKVPRLMAVRAAPSQSGRPLSPPLLSGTCQSENSIAAHDGLVVAGWNDGRFFARQPGSTGYGYSRDGGATWTDGGAPPVVQTGDYYFGDPSLTVDAVALKVGYASVRSFRTIFIAHANAEPRQFR